MSLLVFRDLGPIVSPTFRPPISIFKHTFIDVTAKHRQQQNYTERNLFSDVTARHRQQQNFTEENGTDDIITSLSQSGTHEFSGLVWPGFSLKWDMEASFI